MSPAPRSRAHRGPNRYGHSKTSDVQAKEAERYGVKLDDGKLLKVPPFCAQQARIRWWHRAQRLLCGFLRGRRAVAETRHTGTA